jgi:hypothetical protein
MLGAFLMSSAAWAYRPFDQTDADVAEPARVELEVGPVDFGHSSVGYVYEPTFVLNYGFLPGWELVLDSQVAPPDLAANVGQTFDAELGVLIKHVVRKGSLQDALGPSVAMEGGALLPPMPTEPGALWGASLAVIVSEKWEHLTLHVNVQGAYTRTHSADGIFGFILEGPQRWRVRPVFETYCELQQGLKPSPSVLGGAIWRLSPDFSVDAAFRVARESTVFVQELRAGFTWAFSL